MKKNQYGAALAISLMILLAMTIIGLAAIRSVTLEDKMANNARNFNIAFQSAELGLRLGERHLQSFSGKPEPGDSPILLGKDKFYELSDPASYTNDQSWTGSHVKTDIQLPESAKPTAYSIEVGSYARDTLNIGQQQDLADQNYRAFYRILAQGVGASETAKARLASTYARR